MPVAPGASGAVPVLLLWAMAAATLVNSPPELRGAAGALLGPRLLRW